MIVINTRNDIEKIKDRFIQKYIENLFDSLIKEYCNCCANGSLEPIGAIYYVTSYSDFERYQNFGLSSPINESRFEFIEDIGNDYCNGCIVINNDKCISIIGKTEFFKRFREEQLND